MSKVKSRSIPDTSILIKDKSKLQFPIVAAPMDTVCGGRMAIALNKFGAVGIIHRFQSLQDQYSNLYKPGNEPICDNGFEYNNFGFAIGVTGDYKERIKYILDDSNIIFDNVNNAVIWICFDTANGFTKYCRDAIKWYQDSKYYNDRHVIIAGNVASLEGYRFLADLNVDIVRCGIGNGSCCTTGIVTGAGQGIVSTIIECSECSERKFDDPLIMADGGIKGSGEIAKALAVGADLVMTGALLAGFYESPGIITIDENGRQYMNYRGMASAKFSSGFKTPEGIEHIVEYKGSVVEFLKFLKSGLQSSMSYFDAENIEQFIRYFANNYHSNCIALQTYFSHIERTPFIKNNGL
jgi:IMP dehydrogenase